MHRLVRFIEFTRKRPAGNRSDDLDDGCGIPRSCATVEHADGLWLVASGNTHAE